MKFSADEFTAINNFLAGWGLGRVLGYGRGETESCEAVWGVVCGSRQGGDEGSAEGCASVWVGGDDDGGGGEGGRSGVFGRRCMEM